MSISDLGTKVKIITRAVLDWDGHILEEDSYDYSGPLATCKDSGSPPQAVDPWQQAAAQYSLDTGTANYNAGLNRTNTYNPLGSNTWSVTGQAPSPFGLGGGTPSGSQTPPQVGKPGTVTTSPGAPAPAPAPPPSTGGVPSWSSVGAPGAGYGAGKPGTAAGGPIPGSAFFGLGGSGMRGAPIYSNQTSLQPWANKMLSGPINTSGLAGMPGGPSTTADLKNTQDALYNSQESYIKPQQDLAHEQLQSQLANEGITPGSAAYKQALDQEGRQNTFTNNQTINSAITGGGQEQSRLFGLGSQGLQNQLAVRNAPISEFQQLQGNGSGGQINAATPDISGAYGQQYSGQLAGYNAQTATNNANTGAVASLAAMAAMYF